MALSKQVLGQLSKIQDYFRRILDLTIGLLADFSAESLDQTMRERSLILQAIDDEKHHLSRTTGYREIVRSIPGQTIKEQIATVLVLDAQVENRIRSHQSYITKALSGLSKTNHASNAYIAHSRT